MVQLMSPRQILQGSRVVTQHQAERSGPVLVAPVPAHHFRDRSHEATISMSLVRMPPL
jgi:hypothetical protein